MTWLTCPRCAGWITAINGVIEAHKMGPRPGWPSDAICSAGGRTVEQFLALDEAGVLA